MEMVWLGLGSNLGDSRALLAEAIKRLEPVLADMRSSSIWKSKARYVENQPDFLNLVVRGGTEKSPQELLEAIASIELAMGRDRASAGPKGPRTIDIDILVYGSRVIDTPDLVVPHPGIKDRQFVLVPLLELDPELSDPISGIPYRYFLSLLPPQGIYPLDDAIYDASYP
jgi:2-amino-4-hydroxy-6-hydroxymethyldihydropteridine diphosphokinase